MQNTIATTAILLLLVFVCQCFLANAESSDCILSLNILLAGRLRSYVHTCDCPQDNGRLGPVARAEQEIPRSVLKSAARSAATIRCIRKPDPRLLPLCSTDPRKFERQASRILRKCLQAKPTRSERRLRGKFRFSRRRCEAFITTFFGTRTAGVWLCECRNDGFDVVVGRAGFITDDSPLGAGREARVVRTCGTNMVEQMGEVCRNSPDDFSILGLQLLQVCCKRGRVRLPNGKFGCVAIVPDDLSDLKVV